MMMFVYTVLDVLAEQYLPVFESRNHATALKSYGKMLSDAKLDPSDYKLFCLGTFQHDAVQDDSKCGFVPVDEQLLEITPVRVMEKQS